MKCVIIIIIIIIIFVVILKTRETRRRKQEKREKLEKTNAAVCRPNLNHYATELNLNETEMRSRSLPETHAILQPRSVKHLQLLLSVGPRNSRATCWKV